MIRPDNTWASENRGEQGNRLTIEAFVLLFLLHHRKEVLVLLDTLLSLNSLSLCLKLQPRFLSTEL